MKRRTRAALIVCCSVIILIVLCSARLTHYEDASGIIQIGSARIAYCIPRGLCSE